MDKLKCYAIYNGQCYVNGYGRKFYKKGVELINVADCNGKDVVKKAKMTMTKALKKCLDFASGTKIEFDAVLTDNNVSYISNVKEIVD